MGSSEGSSITGRDRSTVFCQLLLNFFYLIAKLNRVVSVCSHQFFSSRSLLNLLSWVRVAATSLKVALVSVLPGLRLHLT